MKIGLLFPGYTSQYVGMGKDLYDEYRIVQEYFEEASNCVNINFVKLCFASSDIEISRLVNAYASLFVLGGAVYGLLHENDIIPDVVAGYNNGEVTALFAAGCFSFPDGLYLLTKMSSLFQEELEKIDIDAIRIRDKDSSHPSAIIHSKDYLMHMCNDINDEDNKVYFAINNAPGDYVIVGSSDKIRQLCDKLELLADEITIEFISPEIGLHSEMMKSVTDQLKIYLEKVDFKNVVIPFISGIDGQLIFEGSDLKQRFINAIIEPFDFDRVMGTLAAYDIIIIAAPADDLGKFLKKQYPSKTIMTISKKTDFEALKEMIHLESLKE